MKTIKDSLNALLDFESIEVKEGDTVLSLTQLTGKGVLINVENRDYFTNHFTMDSEMWENFLRKFIHDKNYRTSYAVNRRWISCVNP